MSTSTLFSRRNRHDSRDWHAPRLLAVFAVLALLFTTLAPATASAQSASDEANFISLVNQVRTQRGLEPLIVNTQLTNLSRNWSQAQADGVCAGGAFICHANPISEGITQDWRKLGENVGTGPNVNAVMDAFIASPGHFDNIVDPEFTHIGVGVVWDGNRLYTTHRFMRLEPSVPATSTPNTTTTPTTTTTTPATTAPTTAAPTTAPTTVPETTTTIATDLDPVDDNPSSDEQFLDVSDTDSDPIRIDEERIRVLVDALSAVSN